MDDLISRSVLKAAFSKNSIFEKITDARGMNVLEIIDEQPIAYDVDAVEEQLKQQAEQYRKRGFEHEQKGFSAMADKYYGKQCSYLHAIEIVRGEAE